MAKNAIYHPFIFNFMHLTEDINKMIGWTDSTPGLMGKRTPRSQQFVFSFLSVD